VVPPLAILAAGTGFRRARALFYVPCPAASKSSIYRVFHIRGS